MKIQLALVLLVLILGAQCSHLSHQDKHHKKSNLRKGSEKKNFVSSNAQYNHTDHGYNNSDPTTGRCDGHVPPHDGYHPGFVLDPSMESIEISLAWNSTADLDCSVLITNSHHQIIDKVYYSKTTSDDGAVEHQGDNQSGSVDGYDEVIRVNLPQLSPEAYNIYVVASIYSGEFFFPDVADIYSDIVYDGGVIHHYSILPEFLGRADSTTSVILTKLSRTADYSSWQVNEVDIELHSPESIRHMHEENTNLIQPVLICYETRECPLPEYAHVEHQHPIEDPFDAPQPIEPSLQRIDVGLAWEAATDLDFSIIIADQQNQIIDSVYFSKQTSDDGAITHHGDNRNGDASGYDETISIDLDLVDSNTYNLYIALSVYSSDYYFDYVPEVRSDIVGDGIVQHEFLIHPYELPNADETASVLLGRIFRDEHDTSRWFIKALDAPQLTTFDIRVIEESNFDDLQPIIDCFDNRCNGGNNGSNPNHHDLDPAFTNIDVALGWEASTDLDFSILITDSNNTIVDSVNYGKLSSNDGSVNHQGDNQSGDVEGYDEVIKIELHNVDYETHNFYIALSVYSGSNYFSDVPRVNFDILTDGIVQHQFEIHPENFPDAHDTTSVIMAKIFRRSEDPNLWAVEALDLVLLQNTEQDIRVIDSNVYGQLQPVLDCLETGCELPEYARIEHEAY